MRRLLLLAFVSSVTTKNVFVSSPFDNFRIECPKRAAATELSIRMVESVGQKRQDVVFDLSCETVEDLYPWINIPVGIADVEREDCHYSEMMDPILDANTTFTCAPREYLAGVTRLSDTRIQTMCCRLRSRDEFNCKVLKFNKPIGLSRSTVIENDNQLINAIRIEERNYEVRFCDLAPRATANIMTDERVRPSTTPVPPSPSQEQQHLQQQHKQDPLKVEVEKFPKTSDLVAPKLRTPLHPPPRVDSVPIVEFQQPSVPLIELPEPQNAMDISVNAPEPEPLPTLPPAPRPTMKQHIPVSLSPVTLPPVVQTTAEHQPTSRVESAPVTHPMPVEQSTFPQEKPVFSQQLVEDIVRKIGNAQSEQRAAQIFQQSLNKILQNANEKPIEAVRVQQTGPPAARPHDVHFDQNQFPEVVEQPQQQQQQQQKQHNQQQKFSKEFLPLRKDLDNEELANLQPVNFNGRRRSPIRTHRPHVDIWSSEEDDNNEQIMTEINGSVEMRVEPIPAQKKVVKKIIKKVIRGHRVRETTTTTEAPTELPIEEEEDETTTSETTTVRPTTMRRRTTTPSTTTTTSKKLRNAFFSSVEVDEDSRIRGNVDEESTTLEPRRYRGRTTTPSARRDLPANRKMAENRLNQIDNARDIDEETQLSPFDDPTVEEEREAPTTARATTMKKKMVVETPKIEFQDDEELEEVISKLSVRRADIRRSPVRNSLAEAQFSDKLTVSEKDGVRTHVPRNNIPIKMPVIEPISMTNLADFNSKTSENQDEHENDDENRSHELIENPGIETLEVMKSVSEPIQEVTSTLPTRPTTTVYDPSNFYHTLRPRPLKKEPILRFCSKESAIRDQSNMVIACGLDQDIWTPNRCPENADCFPSHDSLYRICCPVHRAG